MDLVEVHQDLVSGILDQVAIYIHIKVFWELILSH